MKILYINPAAELGGGERSLLDIISIIRKTAPEIELHLLVTDDGPLVKESSKVGVNVHLLPLPSELATLGDSGLSGNKSPVKVISFLVHSCQSLISLWHYTHHLKQIVELIQPNLIHSNGFKAHLLISLIQPEIPIIWHIRDFISSRPIVNGILQLLSSRATMAIANSGAVSQDIEKVIPQLPVQVVYNAIDTEYFYPESRNGEFLDKLANLPPAPAATVRIGLIATFARWKGQDIFLEAIANLLSRGAKYPLRFYIIGGAIYQTQGSQFSLPELESISASLGISDFIGFTGFQQNMVDIYRSLDIVIHASTQPEPFGRTIIEAMACGKPVIVSQAGGAAELFTHNYDAIGVAPRKPMALAAAILDLLDNPEKRQFISEQARHTVTKRFSHERLGEQILAIYNLILGNTKK